MNDDAAEVQQRPAAGAVALAAQRLLPGLREDFVHFVGQRLPVRGVAGGAENEVIGQHRYLIGF